MTTDFFGSPNSDEIKISGKWSITNYLSGNTNKNTSILNPASGSSSMPEEIRMELEKAIAAINASYNKSYTNFDKVFRDLATKRKELKALLTELQATARPVDLAALWSVESNLISTQLKAVENMYKVESERFKQLRDEKKLAKERMGGSAPSETNTGGITNINVNSPLATSNTLDAANGSSPNTVNLGVVDPSMLMLNKSKFEQPKIEEVKPIELPPIPTVEKEPEPVEVQNTTETTAQQTVMQEPPSE